MNPIRSTVFPVPDVLRRDVAHIRVMRYSGDEGVAINTTPNALPGIVFQHVEGRPAIENITTPANSVTVPTLFVYGAGVEPSVMQFKGGSYTTIQVILQPHALNALLGLNAAILKDDVAGFCEFSRSDLDTRMIDTFDDHDGVRLLTDFLSARLMQPAERDTVIEEGLRLIHTHIASVTIKSLLERLNLSERQFERRFMQTVGITPQSYIRVKRFNEAIRLIKTGQHERLTDVAHAMNYYDQSHFIRDIKAFSGMTPKALLNNSNAEHDEQAGLSWAQT